MSTYAFIDGLNLHRGIDRQGWKLDYLRFRVYLKKKYDVERAMYFIGYMPRFESLYSHLRSCGYELVFKRVVQQQGVTKGNCDAELVLHATLEIPNYSGAVLVTGDGDFLCLASHLLRIGKLSCILAPDRLSCSVLLRRLSQNHLRYMNTLREILKGAM